MKHRFVIALLSMLCAVACLAQDSSPPGIPQQDLPRLQLTAGMYVVNVQVAATDLQRSIGLMWRTDMPASEGMLFVFDQAKEQCFWMKNTVLPLSAAFVADDGRIVHIADMKPQSTDAHCSGRPVRYVLEMNQGWFAQKGIRVGTRLGGAPFAPH